MYNEKMKKLKKDFYTEAILGIMDAKNGYITTKQISDLGIHRMYLKQLVNEKRIERVSSGIYIDTKILGDPYYIFSLNTPNAIFSHMTALYFHGLSIKAPSDKYNITVKRNYHNPRVGCEEIFYIEDSLFDMGVVELMTPSGNKIKCYDKERSICDIIRSRKRMDIEHIKYAVKAYLNSNDKNLKKLSSYADKLGVKKEVMDLVEILYE